MNYGSLYQLWNARSTPLALNLIYSTFLGGRFDILKGTTGDDEGMTILIDVAGNAVIGGTTGSLDFPLANPFQAQNAGMSNGFISKISVSNPVVTPTTPTPMATVSSTSSPTSVFTGTAQTTSTSIPTSVTFTPVSKGTDSRGTITHPRIATPCTSSFFDVPDGSTFHQYIRCLLCRGIVSGYADGTFRPNVEVTRGQLAKIISNFAGFVEPMSGQIFEDVTPTNTFYKFIQRLASCNVMGGYECGRPGEPCVEPQNRPYFRSGNDVARSQSVKIATNTFFPACSPIARP